MSNHNRLVLKSIWLAGVSLLLAASITHAAPLMWNLDGVTFDDGGVASGSFVYDVNSDALSDWNISVSGGDEGLFPPFTFTPLSAPDWGAFDANPGTSVQIFVDGNALGGTPESRLIKLTSDASLTNSGGTVSLTSTPSFESAECYDCAPFRLINGGTLTSGAVVPDPGIACGSTLTKNIKLKADLNCSNTVLYFTGKQSKKVTLDCKGHSISTTNGSAIIASNVQSVTIKNCDISTNDYFAHGVLLTNGTTKSKVLDNTITTLGDSSSGVSLRDSDKNKITGNTIQTYGSDGANAVRIRSGSDNNLVQHNMFDSDVSYPVNIQSSNSNKIYDNTLMGPNGYVFSRSFALQTGGLGVDTSGNVYAIENNWGSSDGIGTATAFFMVDPITGLGNSVLPVTMGGKDIDFGFDALDVLPNGTILALPGSGPSPSLYEIDPISGHATAISLNILSGSGKLNGLEATSDTSLLATTNTGGLLNVDLNTGNVTEIGQQGVGWTDVAVHPTSGKAYTVSRRRDEVSNTAHLYEINPGSGQIITESGDTGEVGLSSIDFALDGTLYGNADGVLIEINPTDASVTSVNTGGFGPDPLEPMPKKNKLKGNLFQNADGSLLFPDTITLPTAIEIDISSALVDIGPNQIMVDSAALPFLDEKARITLNNITGTYHNLLVDEEDDATFDHCTSPQCKFVSFNGGTLVFDVNGFTSYSSAENTDPTLKFVAAVVLAEIKALQSSLGISKAAKKKLKAAEKDMANANKLLKKGNIKKGLANIAKAITDLLKAENKGAVVSDSIDDLTTAAESEAQSAIDTAIAAAGDLGLIDAAQTHMTSAQAKLADGKPDKAVTFYQKTWVAAEASLAVSDKMEFIVTVPANTPIEESIYLQAGGNPKASFKMEKISARSWRVRISEQELANKGANYDFNTSVLSYAYSKGVDVVVYWGGEYFDTDPDFVNWGVQRKVNFSEGATQADTISRWRFNSYDSEVLPTMTADLSTFQPRINNLEFQAGVQIADFWMTFPDGEGSGFDQIESTSQAISNSNASWVQIASNWDYESVFPSPVLHAHLDGVMRNLHIDGSPGVPSYPEDDLRDHIQNLKSHGYKVHLKIQVCCNDISIADVSSASPEWFDAWYATVEDMILFHAKIAEEEGVDAMSLAFGSGHASHFPNAPTDRVTRWQAMLNSWRAEYGGPVGYQLINLQGCCSYYPTWPFFDYGLDDIAHLFDSIDIAIHAGIADNTNPTQDHLDTNAEALFVGSLDSIFDTTNLPMVITSLTYASFDGGAMNALFVDDPVAPAYFPEMNSSFTYDGIEQAMIYQAILKAVAKRPQITGVYPFHYNWVTTTLTPDFSIRGKAAEDVVAEWYQHINSP